MNVENILKIIMSEIVVDGMRDKKYQRIIDLDRHDYKKTMENIELLHELLHYTPIAVSYQFNSGANLHGFIILRMEWREV